MPSKRKTRISKRNYGGNGKRIFKYVLPVIFILAVGIAASGNFFSMYSGGWEIQNFINSIKVNGVTYTTDSQPSTMISSWTPKSMYFDVDDEYTGVPNIQIEITDPIAVKQIEGAGEEWFPSDNNPWKEYSKTIGNDTFFWDHWVYTFWVTVNAIPDTQHAGLLSVTECKQSSLNAGGWGLKADVAVMLGFETNFWETSVLQEFTVENATYAYVNASAWGGVMSAYILDNDAGMYGDVTDPVTFTGFTASAPMGSSVGMFDGASPTEVEQGIGVEGALAGVPEGVNLEVYGSLLPGFQWPLLGSITTFATYFKYQLRVDVLTTAGYQIIDGTPPEDPIDPDIIDIGMNPIGELLELLGDAIMGPIIIIAMIAIVLICCVGGGRKAGGTIVLASSG